MNHVFKRSLSLIMAILMVLAMIPANPVHVHAEDVSAVAETDLKMDLYGNGSQSEKIEGVWTYYDSLTDMTLGIENTSGASQKWQVTVRLYKADGTSLMNEASIFKNTVGKDVSSTALLTATYKTSLTNLVSQNGNGQYVLKVKVYDNDNSNAVVAEKNYRFNYTNESLFLDLNGKDSTIEVAYGVALNVTLGINNKGATKNLVATGTVTSDNLVEPKEFAIASNKLNNGYTTVSIGTDKLGECAEAGTYNFTVTIKDSANETLIEKTFVITRAACTHSGGNATCTDLAICEVCGESYGSLLNHNYTYTTDGKGTCECGATTTCAHKDYETETVAATCTTAGGNRYTCKTCGGVREEKTSDALDHDYTYTEKDSDVHTVGCSRCTGTKEEPHDGNATCVCGYTAPVVNYVAKIGEKGYPTLQDAIDEVTDGQTITFLSDITEDVEITKNVTIDGANFKYTGTMTLSSPVNFTVENVKFVKGTVVKGKGTAFGGTYTFNKCEFDGQGLMSYAIDLRATESIVIEECKMKDYAAFLQVPSSNHSVSVKNVEVSALYYGFKIDYSGDGEAVCFENVIVNAGEYALFHSNYGAKTHIINNCTFNGGIAGIYLRDGNTGLVNTFKFKGSNTVSSLSNSEYAKYILTEGATLTAPEGLTVTTDVEGYEVAFANGLYSVVEEKNDVAMIGTQGYETLAEAVEAANAIEGGATVTLLDNVTLGEKLTISGNVTISGEHTITRADSYTGTLFLVNAGATLTLDGGLVIDGNNNWTFDEEGFMAALYDSTSSSSGLAFVTPETGAPCATAPMIDVNGGAVVANNVTIQNHLSTVGSNDGSRAVIKLSNSATLTMTGAKITHCATGDASTVWGLNSGSTLTINEGTEISGNYGGRNGAMARVNNSTVIMNGGSINNNYSVNANGSIFMMYGDGNCFYMNGGEICTNYATKGGNGRTSAIYLHSAGKMVMNGGSICHNVGSGYAGIDSNQSSGSYLTINDGSVSHNESTGGSTRYDLNWPSSNTGASITGGTFTQDVSAWLAPDSGLVYDETTGTYGVTKDIWEMHLVDANGEAHWLSPMSSDSLAEILRTNKIWHDSLQGTYSFTLKLLCDVKIDETGIVDFPMTIDLNGHTITGAKKDGVQVYPVIRVQGDANVTVKNGTITNADYVFVLGASDGSSAGYLTIESGKYHGNTTVASVTKGTLTINGGEFSVDPYEGSYEYLLNCIDANYKDGSAKIVVNGGTFANFNPANNAAEGAGTSFVADGYLTETNDEGATYTVRVANFVAEVGGVKYESLKEALLACTNGETVKLLTDLTFGADDVVYAHGGATGFGNYDQYNPSIIYIGGTKGATAAENQPSNVNAVLDLNGHTITSNADAYLFIIMDNAKVTFVDSIGGGAVINNSANYPAVWAVGTDTLVTIEGGLYQTNSPYGVVHVTHSGDLVLSGGEFKTTTTNELGGKLLVMLNSQPYNNPNYFLVGVATVTINGGTFHDFNPAQVGDDYKASTIEDIKFFDGCDEGFVPVENADGTFGVKEWYDANATTLYIYNVYDLNAFAAAANAGKSFSGKTVQLMADIDLGGATWTPIAKFAGTFNGNGKTISNFYIDATTGHGGFFNVLEWATVKDITLANVTATVGGYRFGTLARSINQTNIDNVTVKNVAVTTTASSAFVAGLFCHGTVNSNMEVNNCTVEDLTVNAENGAYLIGGITAFVQKNGTEAEGTNILENLHVKNFKVVVNDTDGICGVGGLVGQTQSVWQNPHFKNCSVTGLDVTASGKVDVGGFMCYPGSWTYATDCTVEGKIDVTGVTSASNYAGGFFGNYGWGDNVGKGDHKVTNCTADVDIITQTATAGGFVGSGINTENRNKNITLTGCEAKGTVTCVEGGTATIGGFAGHTDRGNYIDCTAAQEPFIGSVAEGSTLTNEGSYVASVGGAYYAGFDAAMAAAKAGDVKTIVIHAPVVITEDTTLDLTGLTLDGNDVLPAIRIQNGANVTIKGGNFINASSYLFILGASDGTSAGNLTIESGSYEAQTSIASVTKGTLTILGGEFKAAEGQYGATYLLNCIDANYKDGSAKIEVKGGTFANFNPADNAAEGAGTSFCPTGYIAEELTSGNFTVREANYVAQIGDTKYDSLQAAIDAANGETVTIKLIDDIVFDDVNDIEARVAASNGNGKYCGFDYGNGAFVNIIGGDVTIDLNGYSITYDLHHDEWCNKRVVSIFYVTDKANLTVIDSVGTGAVTVNGMGTAAYSVAVDTKVTIAGGTWTWNPCKTCDATNAFLYASHGGELYITGGKFVNNVDGESGAYMIFSHYSSKETTENSAGVDYDSTKIEISGGTFTNYNPGQIKYMDNGNDNAEKMDDGCAEGYEPVDNGDGTYSVVPTKLAKVEVEMIPGFWGTSYITVENWAELLAALGQNTSVSVKVTLLSDIELTDEVLTISGAAKKVIDLNGYKITGTVTTKTTTLVYVTGGCELTLLDSSEAKTGGIHAVNTNGYLSNLIRVETDATLVIENGNYSQDASVNGAGMIDSRGDEIITVKGGNFRLYNIGSASNGSPWIFNTSGQNTRNIIVNGGTFNADIIHQYYPFEVMAPKELALVKGEDGIWSFVPAVAYVNEQEWSSAWYTNEVGYATLEEAIAAVEGIRTQSGETSPEEFVTLLTDIELTASVNAAGIKIVQNNFAIKLTAEDVTLTAPEGLTVTTTVEDHEVKYIEGVYTVVETARVAQIGDVQYKTLAAAIAAAKDGDTITFLADITEDVTVNKKVTIDGAGKTYTGMMTLKADTTIKNVNFDGKGYNGYAVETRGAYYVTIENCTAKNYGYGFLQLASATVLTTVKNVTISNMNYGVKVDYSTAVVLENVNIDCAVAAVLNSNYGGKTITIKNSSLSILGTWKRNDTTKTTYVFEGENTVGKFVTEAALDTFKLADVNSTLTAPEGQTVITDVEDYEVEYINGVYTVVEMARVAQIGDVQYKTLAEAIEAAKDGDTILLLQDINTQAMIRRETAVKVTVDLGGYTWTAADVALNVFRSGTEVTLTNGTIKGNSTGGTIHVTYGGKLILGKNLTVISGGQANAIKLDNGILDVAADANPTVQGGIGSLSTAGTTVNKMTIASGTYTGPVTINAESTCVLTGGTFTQDVNEYCAEGYVAKDNGDGTWTVVPSLVKNNNTGKSYASLAKAIEEAAAGDTITFLSDITENVTVSKNLIIDGANFKYTGTISVSSSKTVTIENVNFVKGCIDEAKGKSGNLTVKNCSFDGVDKSISYAVTMRGGNSVAMEGCTVKNYGYGMLYVPTAVTNVTVKGCNVDDVTYGVHVAYGQNVTLENVKMNNVKYGIVTQNYGAKTITIKNCELNGTNPIYVHERNTTVVDTFKFEGNNTISALPASAQAKLVLAAADATLTAPAGGDVTTDVENSVVVYENGTYIVAAAMAKNETTGKIYASLAKAIAEATDGDTITLLDNIELGWADVAMTSDNLPVLVKVEDKSITLDLNEMTISVDHQSTTDRIYAVVYVADGASLTVTGNGTIDVNTDDNTPKVAYMFWKRGTTGTLTIENGNYHMDNSEDSMVYTNGNEIVTVKGGTFTLDKIGTRSNGFPCIFNVKGQNEAHVLVTGGTYNYDVNHQYWAHEVQIAKELAVKSNGDGTWTVVPAAAYAVEVNSGYNRYIGYATLAEAYAAAAEIEGIKTFGLVSDNAEAIEIGGKAVFELNGKSYTGTITLTDAAATLTAAEGLTVTTNVADSIVKYADGVYSVLKCIEMKGATLNYKDMIQIVYRVTVNCEAEESGILVFASKEDAELRQNAKEYALKLQTNGFYYGYTDGIPAKNMGESQFTVAYVKLSDGTMIYSDILEYSPRIYAQNMVAKESTKEATKLLCRALMQYGAAAQMYMNYKTDELMNEGFDAIEYDASVLGESIFQVDKAETNGFTAKGANVEFKGALTYLCAYAVNSTIADKELYAEYTVKGKTDSVELVKEGKYYVAHISGIAAKDMDEKIVIKPYYLDDNGNKVYGAELVYSGYEYARNKVNSENANMAALAKAFAMYINAANNAIK